jgi:cellulose synthase operon protein C
MTVRWKPLLILSGLFLAVALVGVVAITLTLVPRSAQGILARARSAREAGRFDDAEIYFKQALQLEAKNAAIHEEFARLYREWAAVAPAERQTALRNERLQHLLDAAKYDKTLRSPREQLLADAMREDLVAESIYWAKDVLGVDSANCDAHYVLAAEAVDGRTPNVPDARRHLDVLEAKNAPLVRRLWIRAKLAEAAGDAQARQEAVEQALKAAVPQEADPVDRMAKLRITCLGIATETDRGRLDGQLRSLHEQVTELSQAQRLAPGRVKRIRVWLEQAQRALSQRAGKLAGPEKKAASAFVDAIDVDLESIFKLALAGDKDADLQTYLSYAEHLLFRSQRERCLEIVGKALKSPQATRPSATQVVMSLHSVAIQMALAEADDAGRFDKAAPHIQALLECADPRLQGVGHLFQGSIDLDRSGIAKGAVDAESPADRQAQSALRSSALYHLKIAATRLTDVAEAQARYGVALVLAGEQSLGRQFLQTAMRLGSLDAQYQLWAAWTILQAGYPEEAEPIVAALESEISAGQAPSELAGALHLLRGEIFQAKRTPEDLSRAVAEFDQAIAAGHEATSTAVMRLAQIDVQLGNYVRALARIDALKQSGKGSPAAEQLAVLTLVEQSRKDEARARLRAARQQYPKSPELVGVEAALLVKEGKPKDADLVLAQFLSSSPDQLSLVLLRAQIQVDALKNADQARSLLSGIADKTESSAPLVQLAGMELDSNQLDKAEAAIAKIRARWKEAATADVLEAQLALKRGRAGEAVEHFDAALKKDPNNKIVQFWKAQLDSRTGSVSEAAKTLEAIVRDKPVKELDTGITLLTAAQSALASLSLRTGDLDAAIRRFEELKRSNQNGTLNKDDRWQLITAYVARGQWPLARRELTALLKDAKNPPSNDERVRAANFFRQQGEDKIALAQLDYVLELDAAHTPAVVTRSYIMLSAKQYDQAKALLHKAVDVSSQKKEPVPAVFDLMLAAVEHSRPPADTAIRRTLAVLDRGLARSPDAEELVRAKYVALRSAGDEQGAIEFVESKAKAFPKGPFRRDLVSIYRERMQYDRAGELLRELHDEFPDDTNVSAAWVQVISLQAADAGARNQSDRERELNQTAGSMIKELRARFPNNLAFLQAECDMVARRGDFTRAIELTREIDKASKTSTAGAILRARLYGTMGKLNEMADAYAEAVERSPGQLDLRVLLGQTRLKIGMADEAVRQASLVLDADKNRVDAVLLQARALSASGKNSAERSQNQQAAIAKLKAAIAANSHLQDAFHALADIHRERKDRASAIAVLKEDLAANPEDATAVARLVELLAQTAADGADAKAADLTEAKRIAAGIAGSDSKGSMALAVAIGYNRARQLDLAAPFAEAAAAKLNTPAAHLNYGDLLLAIAENKKDKVAARTLFSKAVEQYDLVLKSTPNSVEAVNNKAWILHTYLDQTQQALDMALALEKRANPAALPAEFYDTLGSIQESAGQPRAAEQSYTTGLRKSEDNPVLNYHFGRMIARDQSRRMKARALLTRAIDSGGKLPAPMAQEALKLVQAIDARQ